MNFEMLNTIFHYIERSDLTIYYAKYDNDADLDLLDEKVDSLEKKLTEANYKRGSSKYLIAHINGKVLSAEEKFYRRVEKEFDNKTLLGDIDIGNEESILKEYMYKSIYSIMHGSQSIAHEKVFAYGLIRVALKHYASKTFWPYIQTEYGISVPGNYQYLINEKYKRIINKYGKLYDDNAASFVQNMCMHAFVCDKCADQFFDFLFDFWRLDLDRSIENLIDDDNNDNFDILVDEIGNRVQDIMIHTTMALRNNPVGCKNRFRRMLKMIDQSYWDDADYSSSKNRMTILFNEWKVNPKSSYTKDLKRSAVSRKGGRGEKMLSRPTITFNPATQSFSLVLPKQRLRNCTSDEYPLWEIKIGGQSKKKYPTLLEGKAFLYTEECSIDLDRSQLFEEIEVTLKSEVANYYRRVIYNSEFRLFNSRNRNFEINDDYISKDVGFIFTKKDAALSYVNGEFQQVYKNSQYFDVYYLEPSEGDVLILPDGHALAIGRQLTEGIFGNSRIDGVVAAYNDSEYEITADRERIFFKAKRSALNGTSLTIYNNGIKVFFGKVKNEKLIEFKLDDTLEENYGYIIDLHDYIRGNGIYQIDLSIPRKSIRSYKVCYIKGFNYTFEGAPYIFKDGGRIAFYGVSDVVTNDDWNVTSNKKTLDFSFNESKGANDYVKDKRLLIPYRVRKETVQLSFALPVLYWKYDKDGEWLSEKPEDLTVKSLPNNIYISGNLNLLSAKMYISNADDIEDSEISVNHDTKNDLYYFRTVDLLNSLNREQTYRHLHLAVNNTDTEFLSIICKSIVRNQTISGDFNKGIIYGHFDIFGSNEYSVTLKRGSEIIEEDVPVIDGDFEIECEVQEGDYSVILYELEEDDSGFGSISYKLSKYKLHLIDIRNFSGKKISVTYIRDRLHRFADLPIREGYQIRRLKYMDYHKDIEENYDIYSYLHEIDEFENFTYYKGVFGMDTYSKGFRKFGDVFVIFDNNKNTNEAIINTIEDDECGALIYEPERKMLWTNDSKLNRYTKRKVRVVDDDIYKIGIEIED